MSLLINVLAVFNLVTKTAENLYTYVEKAYKAVIDSQIPDAWVFINRNSIPWVTKNAVGFSFYPDTKRFYTNNINVKKSFDDVVTVEIRDSQGIMIKDVTEFFHTLRWEESPTLYEVVLVFFLTNGILLSELEISKCSLEVMTVDGVFNVSLDSPMAKEPFTKWV